MGLVELIVDVVEVVSAPHIDDRFDHPIAIERRVERKLGRLIIAEPGEHQSLVNPDRVRPYLHLFAESLVAFCRLLDTLTGAVIAPAMVPAPQGVTQDPSKRELGATMSALEIDERNLAALSPVQREILVKNLDRLGGSRRNIFKSRDRVPEHPEISARQGVPTGRNVVVYFAFR